MSSSIKTEKSGAAYNREELKRLCADPAMLPHDGIPRCAAGYSIADEVCESCGATPDETCREWVRTVGEENDTLKTSVRALLAELQGLSDANTRISKLIAALRLAENEIHFPGSNAAEGIDIAALIREVLEEVEGK
jgi:hypothetical protein